MSNLCPAARPFNLYDVQRHLFAVLLFIAATLPVARSSLAEPSQSELSSVAFDIPAQSVPAALSELARQAQVQLFFISDGFENVQANAVFGKYSTQEALDLLLAGTGLSASYSAESGVKVRPDTALLNALSFGSPFVAAAAEVSDDQDARQRSANSEPVEQDEDPNRKAPTRHLEEIVVTGTSIRGVIPESTPLIVYDAIDIRNSGAQTVEQFIRSLPQNNNTLTELGTGVSPLETNPSAHNAVDLRGLGVGTTLVLLNGRRMAPMSRGRAADLSFIPLGAVARVEVLTDGASAIYGADAIGGVVNFVLKDQQTGPETVVSFGGASGGNELFKIDQSFGFNWERGNALIVASYMDRNALDAADRDFAKAASPLSLMPSDTRRNVLLTGSQQVFADITVTGDLLYSTRHPNTVRAQRLAERVLKASSDQEQTVLNLELSRPFSERTNAALLITYAEASKDEQVLRIPFGSGISGVNLGAEESSTLEITAKLDGQLITLPSGEAMYALGAGHIEDEFSRVLDSTNVGGGILASDLSRNIDYAFAELFVPVVSAAQGINGVQRLELTVAARYTDYSDFGDNTSPKIGLLWSPIEALSIRGTFGESFKAPFLTQLDQALGSYLLFHPSGLGFPDIWTPDGSATVLMARGPGNPSLGPEKARTQTFGFDLDVADVTVGATYYKIDYTDRIAVPDPSGGFVVFARPQDFGEFFNLRPTLEEVTQVVTTSTPSNLTEIDGTDAAAVHAATTAFFDNRIQNLSITEMDGLDFHIEYSSEPVPDGELNLGIRASKMFSFEERAYPRADPISQVDTVLFPSDLKATGYIGFQKDRWSARVNLNYVDEYANPFDISNPVVDAWTTLDLLLSYQVPTDADGVFDDMLLGFVVRNVLDQDPPFVTVGTTNNTGLLEPVGFDPANANPIGRFISVQIVKGW